MEAKAIVPCYQEIARCILANVVVAEARAQAGAGRGRESDPSSNATPISAPSAFGGMDVHAASMGVVRKLDGAEPVISDQ